MLEQYSTWACLFGMFFAVSVELSYWNLAAVVVLFALCDLVVWAYRFERKVAQHV